ncbi:hypothetical protein GBAR_LOCUS4623, partial [Geodia barretti]
MFQIQFYTETFHSYTTLVLRDGAQFNSGAEGVYSCIIPDENGVEQVLHFGLYDYGFTSGETALSIITSMTEETTLYKQTQTCSTPLKPSILKSIENKLAAELEKGCKE